MSIRAEIIGVNHEGVLRRQHVHTHAGHNFALVQTEPFHILDPVLTLFLNDTLGADMNTDASFGTLGSIIHDGGFSSSVLTGTADVDDPNNLQDAGSAPFGDGTTVVRVGMTVENSTDSFYARVSAVTSTSVLALSSLGDTGGADVFPDGNESYIIDAVWTGVATTGSWDFSTGSVITQSGANNGDQADITSDDPFDVSTLTDFTALSGKIDLTTYNAVQHNISFQLTLADIAIGDAILLNDFIDVGNFASQSFAIPIADLIAIGTCDGLRIIVTRDAGAKPAFTLDDIRFEISGTPRIFTVAANPGKRLYVNKLRFTLVDADSTGTVTNGTMPGLLFDKLLGVTALTNGILFRRVQNGATVSSFTIRQLSDFFTIGVSLTDAIHDGTDTLITLEIEFPDPLILEGVPSVNFLSLTVQDNLAGLDLFHALIVGGQEDLVSDA